MGHMTPRKPFSSNGETKVKASERVQTLTQRARDFSLYLRDQMSARPLAALAVVAGTSFILGGVLGSRIGRTVLVLAAGYGLSRVVGAGRALDPSDVVRGWTEPGRV